MTNPVNFNSANSIKNFNDVFSKTMENLHNEKEDLSLKFERVLSEKMDQPLEGSVNLEKNESKKFEKDIDTTAHFAKSVGSSIESSLNTLNEIDRQSEEAFKTFAKGGNISVHEVMIASEKASISMQMALQIRNKILSAYNEINQIKV